jgi:hypothetical protein
MLSLIALTKQVAMLAPYCIYSWLNHKQGLEGTGALRVFADSLDPC